MGVVGEGNRECLGWMKVWVGVVREGNRECLGWMKDGCCEGGKSRMFGCERWVLWGREIENVWVG